MDVSVSPTNVWHLRVIDKAAKHGSPPAPQRRARVLRWRRSPLDMIIKFSALRFCEIIVTLEQRA